MVQKEKSCRVHGGRYVVPWREKPEASALRQACFRRFIDEINSNLIKYMSFSRLRGNMANFWRYRRRHFEPDFWEKRRKFPPFAPNPEQWSRKSLNGGERKEFCSVTHRRDFFDFID